jgi:hypothetical protein
MSFHRENVTWQSENGKWNLGFYEVLWMGEDEEWDVEYGSGFDSVYIGYPTADAAYRAIWGPNPGGTSVYDYGEGNLSVIKHFQDAAEKCDHKHFAPSWRGWDK